MAVKDASFRTSRIPTVSGTVWALGLTSLLTDISSEMVASILPVYLVLYLGMSPLAFGIVDGTYLGIAALVRLASGLFADRWRRHKEVAILGYGLSAACRPLLLLAGNAWTAITGVIALDRIGKGIRTAPRDALIAQRTPCRELSTAYGVHRSLDAAGAMLGPVVAFAFLAFAPNAFDLLFVASFGFAVVGVAAIVLFVPRRTEKDRNVPAAPVSLATAGRLLAQPRFRALVMIGGVLGLATISDSFVFLVLQRKLGMSATAFPLFYVGTSLVMSLFAVPFGRAADRYGRSPVLILGYFSLAAVYVLLLISGGAYLTSVLAIVLLGAYYAGTDGVLTAMAAAELPAAHAGTGLSLLATTTNLARFCASIAFGWLWLEGGVPQAVGLYLAALAVAVLCAVLLLRHTPVNEPAPVH